MRSVPPPTAADVWWFDVGALELGPADLSDLRVEERARARGFAFPVDRRRYEAAHVMLRRVLSEYTGVPPVRLTFTRAPCARCGGPEGKPMLSPQPGVHFSLAHVGDAVLVAVACQPVGVDVEKEPGTCVCALSEAMHPGDAATVETLPEPERHEATIGWWVRAEAVLKCTGEGTAHGMDGFAVTAGRPDDAANGCLLRQLAAPPGYQAALALAASSITKVSVRAAWGGRETPAPAGHARG